MVAQRASRFGGDFEEGVRLFWGVRFWGILGRGGGNGGEAVLDFLFEGFGEFFIALEVGEHFAGEGVFGNDGEGFAELVDANVVEFGGALLFGGFVEAVGELGVDGAEFALGVVEEGAVFVDGEEEVAGGFELTVLPFVHGVVVGLSL